VKDFELEFRRNLLIKTLISTMLHMALIDGFYAEEERYYIESVINTYPEYQGQIYQAIDEFHNAEIKEEFISDLLKDCRKYLEEKELVVLVKHAFKVMAIDGTFDSNEYFLIKSYLLAFGLPTNFFDDFIKNLEKRNSDQ